MPEFYHEFWELKFNSLLFKRYHWKRYKFYDNCHKFVTFFTLIVSFGLFVALLENFKFLEGWEPVFIALIGILNLFDLTFDISGNATRHLIATNDYGKLSSTLNLYTDYSSLNAEVIRDLIKDFQSCEKAELINDKTIIEAKAYNETCDSLNKSKKFKIYIYPHQNILPHLFTFPPSDLPKLEEIPKWFKMAQFFIFWLIFGTIIFTLYKVIPAL